MSSTGTGSFETSKAASDDYETYFGLSFTSSKTTEINPNTNTVNPKTGTTTSLPPFLLFSRIPRRQRRFPVNTLFVLESLTSPTAPRQTSFFPFTPTPTHSSHFPSTQTSNPATNGQASESAYPTHQPRSCKICMNSQHSSVVLHEDGVVCSIFNEACVFFLHLSRHDRGRWNFGGDGVARIAEYVASRRYVNVVREKMGPGGHLRGSKKCKTSLQGAAVKHSDCCYGLSFNDTVYRSDADACLNVHPPTLSTIKVSHRLPPLVLSSKKHISSILKISLSFENVHLSRS